MASSLDLTLNLLANTTGFNKGMDGAKFAVNALVSAMAALGIGLSVKALADTADQFATLQARVKVAIGDTGNFQEAMSGVYRVALQTNTGLESTANLYAKITDVGRQMGLNQQQVLEITKTINQAMVLGGGTAQTTNAAIIQLTQGLQSGVLRGDEFNSIMENGPAIAKALAASLGVTTGELRKMAENGELTSEIVIKALQTQSKVIDDAYSKFPITISLALQRIGSAWTYLIGQMDQANGASANVASILVYIADNLGELKRFIDDAASGVGFFVNQLKNIDAGTIDALKTALNSAYDAVKDLAKIAAESFVDGINQIDGFLKALFSFMTTAEQAEEGVSGFKKALDAINIVIGLLRDGFTTIGIAIDGITGAFYQMSASWLATKSMFAWGDTKQQFINDSNEMAQKAEEYYARAQDKLMNFQSATLNAGYEAQKSQKQINEERIVNNQNTLVRLQADEQKAITEQAISNEKRKKLEAELAEAKKTSNTGALSVIRDQLAELDKSDDEFSKANQQRQIDKLKAANNYAQGAIDANKGLLTTEVQRDLLSKGFIVTQEQVGQVTVKALEDSSKSADTFGLTASEAAKRAAKALGVDVTAALNEVTKGITEGSNQILTIAAGFDELKQNGVNASVLLVAALDELAKKAKNQADIDALKNLINQLGSEGKLSVDQVAEALVRVGKVAQKLPADISSAKGALQELGIDSGKFSSIIGSEFKKASSHVQTIANDFKGLRGEGINAQQALGAALDELLKKAENQREIENVRQLYIRYGQDGKLSAQQVADGVDAVNDKLNKQITELDAVTAAFKKFGLMGQAEAQKLSSEYEQAFYVLVSSGQASAEQLQEAYQKWQRSIGSAKNDAIKASLDVAAGLAGVEQSTSRVSSGYNSVGSAATAAGNAGVSAAERTKQAWDNTVTSLSKAADKMDELTRKQGGMTGSDFLKGEKGKNADGTSYNLTSKADITSQLKSGGYSDADAARIAQNIMLKAFDADKGFMAKNMTLPGGQVANEIFNKNMNAGLSANPIISDLINDAVKKAGSAKSSIPAPSVPNANVSDIASRAASNLPDKQPEKTVKHVLELNGSSAEVYTTPDGSQQLDNMLSELERIKKSSALYTR